MYRIFYLEKSFVLSERPLKHIKNIKINDINDLCFTLRNWLEEEKPEDICITGKPAYELLTMLKKIYIFREAAGGIVKNFNDEYLFIKRFGVWDFPKGKIEKNETPQQAAIREVEEETGVTGLKIIKAAPDSWHIYPWQKDFVLKKTYWFLMKTEFKGDLKPQIEEDITEARWLTKEDAKKALLSSYRSLRESLITIF